MVRKTAQAALVLGAAALFAFAWRCDGSWFQRHVFLPQQFFIAANPKLASLGRGIAAAVGLVLVATAVRLPRGAAARRLGTAMLMALPISEIVARWRMQHLIKPELVAAMGSLTAPHPRYGVTFKPSLDVVQPLSGRLIRFQTDAEARRFPGAPIDPELPSLVFTGESAMAGFGLQWDETFASTLGARLHLQVIDLASPNYRLDQSAARLEDALPRLQHPVAVIGMFMPGLIGRSRPGSTSGLVQLWRHLYWSDDALEAGLRSASAEVRRIAQAARQRSAPCVFVVTGGTPPWMLRDVFEAQGVPAVAIEIPPSELLADGHPGPRGSRRIADALESWLSAHLASR